jgi:hypothetical protein
VGAAAGVKAGWIEAVTCGSIGAAGDESLIGAGVLALGFGGVTGKKGGTTGAGLDVGVDVGVGVGVGALVGIGPGVGRTPADG